MARPVDLSHVAVIVSVKPDSPDRVANLARLRDYYAAMTTGAELVVVEQGAQPALDLPVGDDLRLLFRRDDGCHWKTRNMNLGAAVSARPYLLLSDCDTVPHPAALAEGMARLGAGADAAHVHNGIVMNISRRRAAALTGWAAFFDSVRTVAPETVDHRNACPDPDLYPLYGDDRYRAVGGAILCTRAAFFTAGGWNENFVGYGHEDREFDLRLRRLGHAVARVEGWNLYHLDHARGIDSRYASAFCRLNEAEFERVAAMSPEALRTYVDAGFRALSFDHRHDYDRVSTADEESWRRRAPRGIDLSDLVILVLADARVVRYWDSCLRDVLDDLETGFRNYEVRLCETGGTDFRHIHSKLNIVYRSSPAGFDAAALAAILTETGRPLVYRLRLVPEAAAQLQRVTALFDRVRAGTPPAEVFAPSAAGAGAA
ncbi:galactosyltransferase-related protein [Rhodovulum euryhalinum]|nr:galactosyltransferase-related protein [Rhodovulum euryhalinum]